MTDIRYHRDLAYDRARFLSQTTRKIPGPIFEYHGFLTRWRNGFFFLEDELGLLVASSRLRETIPLEKEIPIEQLPHGIRKSVKKGNFKVSTDQRFEEVMHCCSIPRKTALPKDQWLRSGIKRSLRELFEHGHAHSLEAWSGDELAAGMLLINIGAVIIGLSLFRMPSEKYNGAGNAIALELHTRLCRNRAVMFDAIYPSHTSNLLGGGLIASEEANKVRWNAAAQSFVFPVEAAILPPQEFYIRPQQAIAVKNGWPFPR
jgi:leucyl/phenylalanyl-tRNA--protein transferase